jgi:hypothetical protein
MGSDCGPLEGAPAQKASRSARCSSIMGWIMNNVLSLQLAGERARKPRGGSNGQAQTTQLHGQSASNQRLFERLEAENARLRGRVVDLMLQIQAQRDGASYGRVLINSADRWLMSALPPKADK